MQLRERTFPGRTVIGEKRRTGFWVSIFPILHLPPKEEPGAISENAFPMSLSYYCTRSSGNKSKLRHIDCPCPHSVLILAIAPWTLNEGSSFSRTSLTDMRWISYVSLALGEGDRERGRDWMVLYNSGPEEQNMQSNAHIFSKIHPSSF